MATIAQASSITEALAEPRLRPWASSGLMLASDLAALSLSGFLGAQAWILVKPTIPIYRHFWPALSLFLIMFAVEGLYPGIGVGPVELLRKLVRGSSVVYLMLATGIFLTKGADAQSRGEFFSCWLLSVIFLPLFRAATHEHCSRKAWFGVPVVILGAGRTAALLIEKLRLMPELALKPVACLDDDPERARVLDGVPLAGPLSVAREVARYAHARHAIVAMPGLPQDRLLAILEQCSVVFQHVYLVPNLSGIGTIPVSPVDVGGVLALELRHNLLFPINRYLKRALDLVTVIAMAPFALLATALAALWIFIESPGNPFYWHEREGEAGRPIRILKLRTMYLDADAVLEDHLDRNPEAREEWSRFCKLKRDPRVLPGVGRFLRRSSLDELPQFWNILIGQMSLVGPRPFPGYHMREFPSAFRELRTKVRPGLTGLWQISARSEGDLDIQAVLDTYYIRNWSLWLDIYILSRTARAVILGRGAY